MVFRIKINEEVTFSQIQNAFLPIKLVAIMWLLTSVKAQLMKNLLYYTILEKVMHFNFKIGDSL